MNKLKIMGPEKTISYYIINAIVRIVTLLPMWAWYWLTGIIYFVVYYLIKYRRKVVYSNLKNSFPEKSSKETEKIAKTYYRHIAQMMIENFYLRFVTKRSSMKKITIKNPELLNQYCAQGRSAILMFGHNGNWEYTGNISAYTNYKTAAVYKKQSSPAFDRLYYDIRSQMGVTPIEMKETMRKFIPMIKEQPTLLYMLGDQSPMKHEIHHWVNFLNQKTGVYQGTEKLAKKFDLVVFYCEFHPSKRGTYHLEFSVITDNAPATAENYITNTFFELLENSIKKYPPYWLWSHRRWKHTPQEN